MSRKDNGRGYTPAAPSLGGSSTDQALLVMAIIWGANFPLIKATLAEIPPHAFNALRFPLASLTVLLAVRWRGGLSWPAPRDRVRIVALGLLGNVAYQGLFITGIDATLAGNAAILLATVPVWTLTLSALLGHERPSAPVWGGILATLAGMVLVVMGGGVSVELARSTLKGDLLLVGAAMTWSVYTVGSRSMIRKYGALEVAAWTLWVGSFCLVLLGLPSLLKTPVLEVSLPAWGGVAYAGILAIGLAYMIWNRGLKKIGSSRTAAYQNLTPIVALAVAWIWLGEVPRGPEFLGAAVVLGGVTLAQLGREK